MTLHVLHARERGREARPGVRDRARGAASRCAVQFRRSHHRTVGSVDGSTQCGAALGFELFSQANPTHAAASMNATVADYSYASFVDHATTCAGPHLVPLPG